MKRIELVVAVLVDLDSRVALQRRQQKSKFYPGMLSLFGGHLEKWESPEMAINRELYEELDITPQQTRLQFMLDKFFDAVVEYVEPIRVHIFQGDLPPDHTLKDGAMELYELSEALQLGDLVPTARAGLEHYADIKERGN